MATIRKRGNRYHVQVRRKGFPPVTRSFLNHKDALEWGREIETQIDRRDLEPDRSALDTTTLGDVITRYRKEVAG